MSDGEEQEIEEENVPRNVTEWRLGKKEESRRMGREMTVMIRYNSTDLAAP